MCCSDLASARPAIGPSQPARVPWHPCWRGIAACRNQQGFHCARLHGSNARWPEARGLVQSVPFNVYGIQQARFLLTNNSPESINPPDPFEPSNPRLRPPFFILTDNCFPASNRPPDLPPPLTSLRRPISGPDTPPPHHNGTCAILPTPQPVATD